MNNNNLVDQKIQQGCQKRVEKRQGSCLLGV